VLTLSGVMLTLRYCVVNGEMQVTCYCTVVTPHAAIADSPTSAGADAGAGAGAGTAASEPTSAPNPSPPLSSLFDFARATLVKPGETRSMKFTLSEARDNVITLPFPIDFHPIVPRSVQAWCAGVVCRRGMQA
jgi:hypothetical protein